MIIHYAFYGLKTTDWELRSPIQLPIANCKLPTELTAFWPSRWITSVGWNSSWNVSGPIEKELWLVNSTGTFSGINWSLTLVPLRDPKSVRKTLPSSKLKRQWQRLTIKLSINKSASRLRPIRQGNEIETQSVVAVPRTTNNLANAGVLHWNLIIFC